MSESQMHKLSKPPLKTAFSPSKCFLCLCPVPVVTEEPYSNFQISDPNIQQWKNNNSQEFVPILSSLSKLLDLEHIGLNVEFLKMLAYCDSCKNDLLIRIHTLQNQLVEIQQQLLESKELISQIILRNYGDGIGIDEGVGEAGANENSNAAPENIKSECPPDTDFQMDEVTNTNDDFEYDYKSFNFNYEDDPFLTPTFDVTTALSPPPPIQEQDFGNKSDGLDVLELKLDRFGGVNCTDCKASFRSVKVLMKHMKFRHPSKLKKCPKCCKNYWKYAEHLHKVSCIPVSSAMKMKKSSNASLSVIPLVNLAETETASSSKDSSIKFEKQNLNTAIGRKKKKTKEMQIFPIFSVGVVESQEREPKKLSIIQDPLEVPDPTSISTRISIDPLNVDEESLLHGTGSETYSITNPSTSLNGSDNTSEGLVISDGSLIEIIPDIRDILSKSNQSSVQVEGLAEEEDDDVTLLGI